MNKKIDLTMMGKNILPYGYLIITVVALIVMVAYSGKRLVYDESSYMSLIPLLKIHGLTREFFYNMPVSAGPLFAFIHLIFSSLTLLAAPAIRFVSILFLILTIMGLAGLLGLLKYSAPLKRAALLMSFPTVYVVSGMALTDSYSLTFCTIALMFTISAFQQIRLKGWIFTILAGIFWALTLLGRQSYIPALLAVSVFLIYERKLWPKVTSILLMGILPIGILFNIWGGLLPPQAVWSTRGFAPKHFILALAYAGLLFLILSPQWLFSMRKKRIFFIAVGGFILNCVMQIIYIVPMYELVSGVFKNQIIVWLYGYITSAVFMGLALVTLCSFLQKAWERRKEKFYLYSIFAVLAMLFSAGMVTVQFSSRYVITVAPFLIILATPYIKYNGSLVFRVIGGAVLGLLCISAYLFPIF